MDPNDQIDQYISDIADWRGIILTQVRKAILNANAKIIEEWKWMGSPTRSRDGLIAVANIHKNKMKITFTHGAHLADLQKLFNAGFSGKT